MRPADNAAGAVLLPLLLPLLLLIAAACSSRPDDDGGLVLHHVVTPDAGLRATDVRVTFEGGRPGTLRLARKAAGAAVTDLRAQPGDRPLTVDDGRIALGADGAISGITYRVLLDRVPETRPRAVLWGDDAVALEADLLLVRAEGGADVTVSFSPPPGTEVASPLAARDGATAVPVPPAAFSSVCYVTLSHRPVQRFRRAGIDIEIARLGDTALTDADVQRWIGDAVEQVVGAFGRLRSPRLLVILSPTPGGGEPRFGVAYHGGGEALLLHIGEETAAGDVRDDWIGQHEAVHTGLPRFRKEDAWLSEGLATYYQCVLRARSGHLTGADAWWELADGCRRGASRTGSHTLENDSSEMGRRHAYWRVYWSGAAIALLWDVELRREHSRTLDQALAALHAAPANSTPLSATDALDHLDAWLGEPLFSRIAREHLASASFPAVADTLAYLGASLGGVDDAAPGAAMRRAIGSRP